MTKHVSKFRKVTQMDGGGGRGQTGAACERRMQGKERKGYVLVSTRTGNANLCPVMRSRRTPILASTSTLDPGYSGRDTTMWWTKSATSLMNSSSGSTPTMDRDSGGSRASESRFMLGFPLAFESWVSCRDLLGGGGEGTPDIVIVVRRMGGRVVTSETQCEVDNILNSGL